MRNVFDVFSASDKLDLRVALTAAGKNCLLKTVQLEQKKFNYWL